MSTNHADVFQRLIKMNGAGPKYEYEHLCKGRKHQILSWKDMLQAFMRLHQERPSGSSASSSRSTSGSSSDGSANESFRSSTTTLAARSNSQSSVQTISAPQSSVARQEKSITMPSTKELYILFGVKGPRRTLELAQIDTTKCTDDDSLFSDLLTSYKSLRGFWRYWFSVWRLNHCDFVKVCFRA